MGKEVQVADINTDPLTLKSFVCRIVQIPLRVKVSHHLAQRVMAENVLLTVYDANGREGWGECCPREYVTGESLDSVQQVLAEYFIPQYLGQEFATFEDVVHALSKTAGQLHRDQQAAFCALELAVLDLAGRHFQQPVTNAIGKIQATEFCYSGVLAADDLDAVIAQGQRLHQFGFEAVKVKVTRDSRFNRLALKAVRELFGSDVSLRVDANGAWTPDEAIRELTALAEFNLDGVEQPVAGDDFAGMSEVTAAGIVPVVADESICSMADAERLIAERGCDIFNLRISKCGGLVNSARISRRAMDAGLKCQLGAQVGESGFLSAAGRHLAMAIPNLIWLEGSFDAYLLGQQITTPDISIQPGGRAVALTSPGLGVDALPEVMQATSIRRYN